MSVHYVNLRGESVNPDLLAMKHKPAPKASTALKTLDTRDGATLSMGFDVTGFSPAHLAEAKRKHEIDLEGQKDRKLLRGEKLLVAWSEEVYMRETKPKRVAPKPYALASSADQCADMARKAGWKNVAVREILKG